MSLPPELGWLSFQLASISAEDLPRHVPELLRLVLRCGIALSSPAASKSTPSEFTVPVHKLRTQISSLLNGKSPEGRFAAVVLVKGAVEVGEWEVLQTSEQWVRGLLSILVKPDTYATKELCIITLTKIYCMTLQYQTLVREITTPTLPAFITSCLNLLSSKSTTNKLMPSPLTEVVFWSFATLLPRHTTIYRPFASQIRTIARPYLASTLSEGFVPSSVQRSARRLAVLLHQTAAKSAGGEEWGKAFRSAVKEAHVTADQVLRAVIETWESTAGYIPTDPDIGLELSGGGEDVDSLPPWQGVDAGIQRLVGLLGLIEEYFKPETSFPVAIPLAIVVDLIDRMLMVLPSSAKRDSLDEAVRIRSGIDRKERDGLWSGIPAVYIGALQLLRVVEDRLQASYLTLAQGSVERVAWVFSSGKHDPVFRVEVYQVIAKSLRYIGRSIGKQVCDSLLPIIQACCHDLSVPNQTEQRSSITAASTSDVKNANGKRPLSHQTADTFLHGSSGPPVHVNVVVMSDIGSAASDLLPLCLSHLPQESISLNTRSLLERTVILSRNKSGMLASILNPWIGKLRRRVAPSLLPYASGAFSDSAEIESLLRPRMPLLQAEVTSREVDMNNYREENDESDENGDKMDEDSIIAEAVVSDVQNQHPGLGLVVPTPEVPTPSFNLATSTSTPALGPQPTALPFGTQETQNFSSSLTNVELAESTRRKTLFHTLETDGTSGTPQQHSHAIEHDTGSDDGSVHLVMELESDSDSDSD
ncbi:rRNA processing/ribosome biogenesis-domain-containing protein [Calycina marina]|uniref:Pre-rRNA-processing protein RIX1 n=1 Tax=Calycina marina TaxID=1763456 RepID=A0A9P7ZCU7_9HELO|nr:rRNA processing/ribosome biogenesis-domain-containing protein [Calycina marina]